MSATLLVATLATFLIGDAASDATPVLPLLGSLLTFLLAIAILIKQTRRYWLAKRSPETETPETETPEIETE